MSLHTAYFEEEESLLNQIQNLNNSFVLNNDNLENNNDINFDQNSNNENIQLYKNLINQNKQQQKEINEKERLILTRDRMLQISYDRNLLKKKVIYTIVAFILAVLSLIVILMFKK